MIKYINTRKYSVLFIALCLWVTSCRSTDDAISDENNSNGTPFNVIVNLTGTEIEEGSVAKIATTGGSKAGVTGIQQFEVPFDDLTNATVSLTPERSAFRTQASVNPVAGTPLITELGDNIVYKVAVYKTDGSFVDEKTLTFKTNNTNDQQGFMLNGDQTYTFVAYSVNSTSAIPVVNNAPRTLATDKLSGISGDLMYFKQNMTVSGNGKNYISVVLKHKFTKITTVIDATGVGNISVIDKAGISPVGTTADIKLSDGSLTYNGSVSQFLNFKGLDSQMATSAADLFISHTLTLAPADLGLIFDIYNLDDSFNLTINGTKIAQNEILFGASQGIVFADGSKYESGEIPKVWFMSGTRDKPVVRVVVNRDGKVSMYGSKASGGRLYPLVLVAGNSFNTVTWNTTGINTIVSQVVGSGSTVIKGDAVGIQKCTN